MKYQKQLSFLLVGLLAVGGITAMYKSSTSNNQVATQLPMTFELDSEYILYMHNYDDENGKFEMTVTDDMNIDEYAEFINLSDYDFIDDKYVLTPEQSKEFFYNTQLYGFEHAVKEGMVSDEDKEYLLGTDYKSSTFTEDDLINAYANLLNNAINDPTFEL